MGYRTLLYVIGFVLLWNSGFIGAEYGLPFAGPFTLLFWRYLGLTLLLFIYLLFSNRLQWVGWALAGPHMLIGVLAHGVWLSCVLLALDQAVPAGIVALVVALQPLATGALSGQVTGETTARHQWIGLGLGFSGVLLTVLARIDFGNAASIFGYLIPFGSVVGITVATLIQRHLELQPDVPKLPLTLSLFYQSLPTLLFLSLPAWLGEGFTTQWTAVFIYTELWLTVAVSFGAYALLWLLLERLPATRVASLFYLGPPVTLFLAWLAFGDTLQRMDVVGLLVVLSGVYFTQRRKPLGHQGS